MTIKPSADRAAGLKWFKSSYSTSEGPECIEVASAPGTVHVRDSKDKAGAQLAFTDGSWAAFVPFAASR
ncbi:MULTISPECIES: DUF397 domain-containing protein [unclassified Streptomyces]|uniref:DUF397 domain-containing protein n=1 Tax=unclassified Streptomyces TaxID=2593676 RepID=UPI002787A7E3|nr:DUF397 domain-containing protein [Streptomyces sp. V1I1]MDQ0944268.1 hypothetical protein [Streptomyces sp. V1I1]